MTVAPGPGGEVPGPGDRAPGFTLPDVHGTPLTLDGLHGTPVLLVFVPFAFSGVCSGELGKLRDDAALARALEVTGARLLVVSCDSMITLRAWDEREGFGLDLLSDFWPHGAVARSYGVLDEGEGYARRATFLIGADGLVCWNVVNPRGVARDVADYRAALAAL